MAKLTRWGTWVVTLAAVAFGAHEATAESFLLVNARVVWIQGNRVYIASRDSVTIPPATQLAFRYKQDVVANGEVTAIYQSELIAAVITSGSLSKIKQLDKVEITARPPEFRPPTLIRVGYPAAGRKNLLFDCTRMEPDTTVLQGAYRPESLAQGSYRFVRDPAYAVARTWPDTLLVRMFEEVADEEIALERGDVDVAVFWPGEASAHIREAMECTFGSRRGVRLACRASGPKASYVDGLVDEERKTLERMNLSLFRGDVPLPRGVRFTSEHPPTFWFDVDPAIPGHDTLQRFLNVGARAGSATADRVLHLKFEAWSVEDFPSSVPAALFTPRSPVIPLPGMRSYIAQLDRDALVGLFTCLPAGAKP